jgi:hypothetical protein
MEFVMRYTLILSALALSLLASNAAQAGDWRDHRGDRHDRYDRYDRHDRRDNHWRRDRSPSWSFNYVVTSPRPVYYYPAAPTTNYYYTPVAYNYSLPKASQGYCREYTGPIRVGGRVQQGYGTACLQPDGSWQMID